MGLEGEGEIGKDRGEISEMDIRSGQRDAGLFGKGGITKREVKRESGKEGLGIRKKTRREWGVRWREYAGRS